MKTKYLCPHCKNTLSIEDNVILVAKTKSNTKGLVILHTELGNYSSKTNEDFKLNSKEETEFYCPICSNNLEHKTKKDLVSLVYIDENNKESTVVFSKTYKKDCTYHIVDKQIFTYGENAKKFRDPEWFL